MVVIIYQNKWIVSGKLSNLVVALCIMPDLVSNPNLAAEKPNCALLPVNLDGFPEEVKITKILEVVES